MGFRAPELADFPQLPNDAISASSYKNLTYPLGCSSSELAYTLDESEFLLFGKDKSTLAFFRIKSVFSGLCYFDFYILNNNGVEAEMSALMKFLRKRLRVGKFYAMLLPNEEVELSCLQNLDFSMEVRMREHVYLNAKYNDLLLLGSPDSRR